MFIGNCVQRKKKKKKKKEIKETMAVKDLSNDCLHDCKCVRVTTNAFNWYYKLRTISNCKRNSPS